MNDANTDPLSLSYFQTCTKTILKVEHGAHLPVTYASTGKQRCTDTRFDKGSVEAISNNVFEYRSSGNRVSTAGLITALPIRIPNVPISTKVSD